MLCRLADIAAASHDKIGILTALQPAAADKVQKQLRHLPRIGRRYENPWFSADQFRLNSIFDVAAAIQQLILQFVCQQLRAPTAVACSAEINNHNHSSFAL